MSETPIERPVERVVEHRVVEAQPVVEQRVVETAPAYATDVAVVEHRWAFTPAQIIGMICGAILVVLGIVALVRGDLKGSINDPVVSVAGWKHTPLLGLIEIGGGIALLLASTALGAEMFIGAVVAAFGVVALIEPKVLSDNLEIASSLAWVIILLGAVPFVAAAIGQMAPVRTRRASTVTRVEHI